MSSTHPSLAERLGVADYLVKPIGRERVGQILRGLDRSIKRLLVVDDDPDAARLLARVIRSVSRKYVVKTAFSGADALRAVEQEPPDAVLVDLIMPDVDGYTVIETIRNQPERADIPIIAVSAQALGVNPLAGDSLIALGPGGIAVSSLLDCVRYTLSRLAESVAPSDPIDLGWSSPWPSAAPESASATGASNVPSPAGRGDI